MNFQWLSTKLVKNCPLPTNDMIKIYAMADTEFQKIDKLVVANFSSMDSENYFSNRAGNCVIKRKI